MYLNDIYALLPDNGSGEISAEDLRDSFGLISDWTGQLTKQGTGYIIYDSSQLYPNHGTLGNQAIDLSNQNQIDPLNGAVHDYSFCTGFNTRTSSEYSTILGQYNNPKLGTLLEVGCGDSVTRRNAIEVFQDGTSNAPISTIASINARGAKCLATKEYVDQTVPVPVPYTFTGDNVNTVFTVPLGSFIQVFNKGILEQETVSYSLVQGVNSTITFNTPPDSGAWVYIIVY